MKVITISLLAALVCFAVVNAAIDDQLETADLLVDEAFSNEIVEVEARSFFSGFFWYLKSALRTLKGVNCTVKEAILIKTATQNFIDNIYSCGNEAVQSFKNVLTSAHSVITTCNNIIHLNENFCNNDGSTNGKKNTPFICFLKLLRQLLKLRNQIKYTLRAIKNVPAVPGEATVCSNNAVNELTNKFTSFPSNIKTCSKLTN